jgi:hypothetical protein
MNTFALVLFAWLLYLAVNGKLVEFVDLATGSSSTVKSLSKAEINMPSASNEISSATITP